MAQTSPRVARKAGKILRSKRSTAAEKSVAGSAVRQARRRRRKR